MNKSTTNNGKDVKKITEYLSSTSNENSLFCVEGNICKMMSFIVICEYLTTYLF